MKFRHRVELVGYLLFIGFCVFLGWLVMPTLKAWLPTISNLLFATIAVFLVVLMLSMISIPLLVYKYLHGKAIIQRLEAGKLPVNERGYMAGYISTSPKDRLIVPQIALHSPEVPAHLHLQMDQSNKGGAGAASDWRAELEWAKLEWEKEKVQMLNAPAEQKQIGAPRPTIETIVSELSDADLEFSTGTSLTTNQLIKVELKGKHIKVIGGSQMGKTSLIGAILEQMRQKYSVNMLRLAILDLEDMTGLLFEDDPHILEMRVGGQLRKVHARNPEQVAQMLTWLDQVMLYRYELIQQKGLAYVERQPRILIYFEEFLDWKKTLAVRVPDESLRDAAIAAINAISTRGLKVGMHMLIAAQVDYADKELQSAMAQFVGLNVAFAVKPKAAQAAGFVDSARLAENYAQKRPGQYVVEMIGGGDMGISPEFDVKGKIKALQQGDAGEDEIIDGEFEEMEDLQCLPTSAKSNLPISAEEDFGRLREDNREASGRSSGENPLDNPFVLKRLLNSAGKMRAEGASIDAILKAHGLTPGGRNNQNLKALLDGQDQAANE